MSKHIILAMSIYLYYEVSSRINGSRLLQQMIFLRIIMDCPRTGPVKQENIMGMPLDEFSSGVLAREDAMSTVIMVSADTEGNAYPAVFKTVCLDN